MYQQGDLFEAAPPPVTMVDFPSSAKINQKKFSGDNRKVFDALVSGRIINRTSIDMLNLTLHSRISDLRNKFQIEGIEDKKISVTIEGKKITISSYWMTSQAIEKFKNQFQ